MYEIELSQDAVEDLKHFKKFEQQQVIAGIEAQLQSEPSVETRNRKRLRPNDVAEWELRLGRLALSLKRVMGARIPFGAMIFTNSRQKR
jgi:hypothetical protein